MNKQILYKGKKISVRIDRYGQTIASINGINRVYLSSRDIPKALDEAKKFIDGKGD